MNNIDVGNKLRILRHEANFSQQEVAEKLGISKSSYCRMESNEKSPDLEELDILCNLYTITINEFYQMEYPVSHTVVIPKSLLDNLENVIEENKEITLDWNKNRERFNVLREAFEPVFDIRMKACDFPDLDPKFIEPGTTVKTVKLDLRCEYLMDQYFELQKKYCKALFGGE